MISNDSDEWVIPQHKVIKKLDLMEIRIMKLASDVNHYKDIIEQQNITLDNMQDTISKVLDKVNERENNRDEDLKVMAEEINKSHDKLQENLSSIYFKQRRDNIFWRSYNNKFSNNCNNVMGFGEVLFSGSDDPKKKKTGNEQSQSNLPIPNKHTPVLKLKRKSKIPLTTTKTPT
jgi:hypothetical protein